MRHRDELCKRGEVLLSPALNFSIEDLQKEIDSERKEKIAHEMEEKKSEADLKSLDNNKQVGNIVIIILFRHPLQDISTS